MNKLILSLLAVVIIGLPSAFGEVNVMSNYYEMGDFLKIGGNFEGYTIVDVVGDNFKKGYFIDGQIGLYEFGFPITEKVGYTPGIYDVTISYGDTVKTQQFGLDMLIPTFTLYAEKSIVYLNEYAFFHGTVVGIDLYDYSFAGNVLIQILDSNGNLVEDNFVDSQKTSKGVEGATKSEFRAHIKTGTDRYNIPAQDRLHGDKLIYDNGYRAIIKTDPTIYKPYHTYTIRVIHDTLERSVDFMVLDYRAPHYNPNDDICVIEQKNLDHVTGIYNEFVEAEIPSMILKYEILINNFKFSSGCE